MFQTVFIETRSNTMQEWRKDKRDSIFLGQRDKAFFEHIQSELIDNVMMQTIRYYQINEELTKSNIYGESKDKVVTKVYEIGCRVNLDVAEIKTDQFSVDRIQTLEAYIQRTRLYDDYGFEAKIGDYIEYDNKVFEILTVDDDVNLYQQTGFKMQIVVRAMIAKESNIRIDIDNLQVIDLMR